MFTGIVETLGKLIAIETQGQNLHFEIESSISKSMKIDQSVSHTQNLTIKSCTDKLTDKMHTITSSLFNEFAFSATKTMIPWCLTQMFCVLTQNFSLPPIFMSHPSYSCPIFTK